MIFPALLVFEFAVEENGVCDPDGTAWIENHHVVRACDLVHLIHAMRDVWEGGAPDLGAEWLDFAFTQLAAPVTDSRCRRRRLRAK